MTGCASMDATDYRQSVMVTSDPPGAQIYDRGELVGVTPQFVRVRRRKNPEITLKFPGNPERTVPLKRRYRWGDSFAMNFTFWIFAPIGWGVDHWTGTAWKMDDPPEQKFSGRAPPSANSEEVVAIAPPEASDTDMADSIGGLIEKQGVASKGATVLPYKETAPVFEYFSSGQGLSRDPRLRYNLYHQLKANKIFVSKAEIAPEGYLVHGHFLDPFTGKNSADRTWMLTSEDDSVKEQTSEHHFFTEYFQMFPNTLFLNIAKYEPQLGIQKTEGAPTENYTGKSARERTAINDVLNLISLIGLDHLDRPRSNVKGKFQFKFVPSFNASWVKLRYEYKPLEFTTFDRVYANGGYGIEVGHLSRAGYFFFQFVPVVTYTRIHSRTPDEADQRLSRMSIQSVAELGYSRFVWDHLVVKVFTRAVAEDSNLWQNAIRRASHQDEIVGNVTSAFAGIALGYYLPSSINRKGNWKAVDFKKRR